MATNHVHRIAVIPGDGIGKEVVPEGVRVLEAAAKRHGFKLQLDWFDFASCDYYLKHGRMMPDDWKAQIGKHDAIFFGAVGWPEKVPDHISLWGSLILFRREFDQYVNLRPVKLFAEHLCPLKGKGPAEVDFVVIIPDAGILCIEVKSHERIEYRVTFQGLLSFNEFGFEDQFHLV